MFEHFYVILWIYTPNQSHRSGRTLLLRQREAGGLRTHLYCWALTLFTTQASKSRCWNWDLVRTEPSVPIPDCIQSCWESPSHPFNSLCTISIPSGRDVVTCCTPKLWHLGISPCCVSLFAVSLIPGVSCWFLGLVSNTRIALSAPGKDGLAFCSAPALF